MSPGGARVAGVALAALAAAACARAPADKIHGWPPPDGAFEDTVELPDTVEPPDTAVAAVEDTTPEDPDALPTEPCAAVIELACRFYGQHSDECHEARTRVPDGADPETRAVCEELVARFTTGEDATSYVNPCHRYARRLCKAMGNEARACQSAAGAVSRLTAPRQKRACLGDLLIFEARGLRR